MTIDTSKINISKTTLAGVCGLTVACITAFSALPPKAGAAVIAIAVLNAAVHFLMKDAGEQEVQKPNGEVTVEPSHEMPDDPTSKPVAGK